jgi:parvulin-like peptidyl-prolyl isomerase
MKLSKKIILSTVTAVLLSSTVYGAQIKQKIYATVNGEAITSTDVAVILRNPSLDFETLPKTTQDQVINGLIERKLLSNEAIKSGVMKDKDYKIALEKVKSDLALEYWMQKEFKKIKISDKDAKAYYKANEANFAQPESAKARHILVADKKTAQTIIKTLDGTKDKLSKFIELAKTKSTGPSGKNGGDLGWFDAKKMVPEFSEATFKLKVGNYTKSPVKTQFGYHIIFLEDKKGGTTVKFADMKDNIKQQLAGEKFKTVVKKITTKAKKTAKIIIK